MGVLASQYVLTKFSTFSQGYHFKLEPVCQVSANFAELRSQLLVKKRVISQLTVKILTNSQLSVSPIQTLILITRIRQALNFTLVLNCHGNNNHSSISICIFHYLCNRGFFSAGELSSTMSKRCVATNRDLYVKWIITSLRNKSF